MYHHRQKVWPSGQTHWIPMQTVKRSVQFNFERDRKGHRIEFMVCSALKLSSTARFPYLNGMMMS